MSFKNQLNFQSEIDGKVINDLYRSLNDNRFLNKYEDRKKLVQELSEEWDIFLNEYFENHCDVSINTNDFLISETNICKAIESLGTFLLRSDDLPGGKTSKGDNPFYDEEYLKQKINREKGFFGDDEDRRSEENVSNEDEILELNKSNYKLEKKQEIKPSDLKRDDDLGKVLSDYNEMLKSISLKLKEGKTDNKRYIFTRQKQLIKDDMLLTKDLLLHVHGYKLRYFDESTKPNYDLIDFKNEKHLLGKKIQYDNQGSYCRGLLYFKTDDLNLSKDFDCILYDLQNIIDKTNLTNDEVETLDMIRYNYSKEDIAYELNTYPRKVYRLIENIGKKISHKAHELENNFNERTLLYENKEQPNHQRIRIY